MAGNMTSYLEEKILDHIFNGVSYTPPSTIYVGLVSDVATDADLEAGDLTNEITEYTGDRKALDWSTAAQVDGKGTVGNTNQVDFEAMPSTVVEYAIICDSATGGNILYWLPASTVKTIYVDDVFRVRADDINISQD